MRIIVKKYLPVLTFLMIISQCFTAAAESGNRTAKDNAQMQADTPGTSTRPAPENMMKMMIGDTPVTVEWEDNESVEALKELAAEGLTLKMSMYGGFEQVGPIGQDIPRNDTQTTTASGDIVLYSGDQLVVFYGSNSWSYTRLGKIVDKTSEEMRELLGNGDVTITLSHGDGSR